MRIFVPTIQSAGTAFMIDHLFAGWPLICPANKEQGILFRHVYLEGPRWPEWALPCDFTITPMRSLALMEASMRKRTMHTINQFYDLYAAWIRMVVERDAYVLQIDEPEKAQKELDRFNFDTGLDLKSDWRVVPSWDVVR